MTTLYKKYKRLRNWVVVLSIALTINFSWDIYRFVYYVPVLRATQANTEHNTKRLDSTRRFIEKDRAYTKRIADSIKKNLKKIKRTK